MQELFKFQQEQNQSIMDVGKEQQEQTRAIARREINIEVKKLLQKDNLT